MQNKKHPGVTLMELAIVVAIMAIVAGFVIPRVGHFALSGRKKAVKASLAQIRDAILGTPDRPGFVSDIGHTPNSLDELFENPSNVYPLFDRNTGLGWRGPYLVSGSTVTTSPNSSFTVNNYVLIGDRVPLDPWGNPFVLQRLQVNVFGSTGYLFDRTGSPSIAILLPSSLQPGEYSRLISAGPNGIIDTAIQNWLPLRSDRGDDFIFFLNQADPDPVPVNPDGSDPDLNN